MFRTQRSAVRWLLAGLFVLSVAVDVARANAAPPPRDEPKPTAGAPVEVVVVPQGQPMRLEIPQSLLPESEKAAGIFGDVDGLRTIISGLAMSLAVVFGGFWLVRRLGLNSSQPMSRGATAATGAVLLIAAVTVATAWADIPSPGRTPGGKRPRPEPVPAPVAPLMLKLDVVDSGEKLILKISAADLARLAAMGKVQPQKVGAPAPAKLPANFDAPKSAKE